MMRTTSRQFENEDEDENDDEGFRSLDRDQSAFDNTPVTSLKFLRFERRIRDSLRRLLRGNPGEVEVGRLILFLDLHLVFKIKLETPYVVSYEETSGESRWGDSLFFWIYAWFSRLN